MIIRIICSCEEVHAGDMGIWDAWGRHEAKSTRRYNKPAVTGLGNCTRTNAIIVQFVS